jgi:transcriptional regulator with XRE-family HTH domain
MATPTEKEKLGSNIRKARESYNWSQERLAEYINVSTKTISNYEAGNSMPALSAFIAIAEALGYTLDELKDGDFEKGPFGGDKSIAELFYDTSSEERERLIEKMTSDIKAMKAERQ